MARDEVLLTVLQISDLHFGHRKGGSDATIPPMLHRFRRLDGLLGHHYKALSGLHDFYADLINRTGPIRLIISGDLTAYGAQSQFADADSFIGTPTNGRGLPVSLGCVAWDRTSVSGNHDQWPGRGFPLGSSTPALVRYLPGPYPQIEGPIALANGKAVRFLFLDSDADVGGFSLDRFLARGDFRSQLLALLGRLPSVPEDEFRVLVLHHSITAETTPVGVGPIPFPKSSGPRQELEIADRSLRALEPALIDLGVKVVLCGHLHAPRLSRIVAVDGTRNIEVLEARCGTTSQLDQYPAAVRIRMKPLRRLNSNTLILHQLLERSGKTLWRSQVFRLTRQGRFVPAPTQGSSGSALATAIDFQVF